MSKSTEWAPPHAKSRLGALDQPISNNKQYVWEVSNASTEMRDEAMCQREPARDAG
jgi:hypothetical protein